MTEKRLKSILILPETRTIGKVSEPLGEERTDKFRAKMALARLKAEGTGVDQSGSAKDLAKGITSLGRSENPDERDFYKSYLLEGLRNQPGLSRNDKRLLAWAQLKHGSYRADLGKIEDPVAKRYLSTLASRSSLIRNVCKEAWDAIVSDDTDRDDEGKISLLITVLKRKMTSQPVTMKNELQSIIRTLQEADDPGVGLETFRVSYTDSNVTEPASDPDESTAPGRHVSSYAPTSGNGPNLVSRDYPQQPPSPTANEPGLQTTPRDKALKVTGDCAESYEDLGRAAMKLNRRQLETLKELADQMARGGV